MGPTGIRSEQIRDGEVKATDLDSELAGKGIALNESGFEVLIDNVTIGTQGNILGVKDNGISVSKLASGIDAEEKLFNAYSVGGLITDELLPPSLDGLAATLNNTVVDSVAIADAKSVLWQIVIAKTATPTDRYFAVISAVNDGSTVVNFSVYSIVEDGNGVSGVDFNVDISAGNMRLIATAGAGSFQVDYRVTRIIGKYSGLGNAREFIIDIPAGYWIVPATNGAPFVDGSGVNSNLPHHAYDDTTEEFLESLLQIPPNINPSASVTFEIIGCPSSSESGNPVRDINLKIYHKNNASESNWDVPYSTFETGNIDVGDSEFILKRYTIVQSVSSLGWLKDELMRIKLSRIAIETGGDSLIGDWKFIHLRIRIPRI